jgi:hypothetical protein|tara:strand:+ start:136 stop:492 length:357 start_codon:yes stop_codon:yes gene_type:complete
MANPNIVNVANIYGKTVVANPTTSYASVVANSAGSGKVYKINTLLISNIAGAVEEINVKVIRGGINYSLATTMAVPVGAALILISKDTSVYLEEGDDLQASAGSNSALQITLSYEEIS